MPKNDLVMDAKKLEKMRPDLYPRFLEILKKEAPNYFHLIVDNNGIDKILEKFETKMTIQVCDLPQLAQDLVYSAMNEAIEKRETNEQK